MKTMMKKNVMKKTYNKLGLGMMRFSNEQQINNFLKVAFSYGINYIESCSFYINDQCEILLGNVLQQYQRSEYLLGAKFAIEVFEMEYNSFEEYFNQQLINLKTNYFDYYLIQALDRYRIQDEDFLFDLISFLHNKKKEGYIKNLGFSFHDLPEYFNKILSFYNWDFCQLQLNCYDWYNGCAKDLYYIAKNNNLPIMVMNGLKGGLLSQFEIPIEYGYFFLNSLDNILFILNGSPNINEYKENHLIIDKYQRKIKPSELKILQEKINKKDKIPCVECGYCLSVCPQHINIKEVFHLYNYGPKEKFYALLKDQNTALNCIHCHQCEKKCTQKIPISQFMEERIFFNKL